MSVVARSKNVDALNLRLARAVSATVLTTRRCCWCGGTLRPEDYRSGFVLSLVFGTDGVIAEICAHHLVGSGPVVERCWQKLLEFVRSEGLGYAVAVPPATPFEREFRLENMK